MSAAAVGLLVAAAVLLARPPVGRRLDGWTARSTTGGAWPARLRRPRGARTRSGPATDLGVVVTEVATRLRTGADVDGAWSGALRRSGLVGDAAAEPVAPDPGVPAALDRLVRGIGTGRRDEVTAGALPGAVAACRLTHEIGAPMAQVLDRCAQGLTEAGQARSARAVALAGPRASARLIGALPLLGLVMGVAVGADPLAVLLGGGAGTVCLVVGVALLVAGNRWVAALERAARAAA